MADIIFTTKEELSTIIKEVIESAFDFKKTCDDPPDTMTLTTTIALLEENGYPTSKATIYKLTSTNKMPHQKFGHKLIFSRQKVLEWAESQTKSKPDRSDAINYLSRTVRRK